MSTLTLDQAIEVLRNSGGDIEKVPSDIRDVIRDLLDSLPGSGPKGFSTSTVATYYKEQYAKELMVYLDKFVALPDRADLFFASAKFDLSPRTLSMKFNQAWLYLVEKGEPAENRVFYEQLRQQITILKEYNGVRFKWREADLVEPDAMLDDEILEKLPPSDLPDLTKIGPLLEEVEVFINESTIGDLLELKAPTLSKKDMEYVNTAIAKYEARGFKKVTLNSRNLKMVRIR